MKIYRFLNYIIQNDNTYLQLKTEYAESKKSFLSKGLRKVTLTN